MCANKHPNPPVDGGPVPVKLVLEVLMRGISKPDRLGILAISGYSAPTWWNWCRTPRIIPGAALNEILKHLGKTHDRAFTTEEVYKPIA